MTSSRPAGPRLRLWRTGLALMALTLCGACAEVSECTAPAMHPTYWQHPRHAETVLRYVHGRPIYRPPDELRQSMPELYRRDPAV